jgi:hypothetical protein
MSGFAWASKSYRECVYLFVSNERRDPYFVGDASWSACCRVVDRSIEGTDRGCCNKTETGNEVAGTMDRVSRLPKGVAGVTVEGRK